tara:strand:- start:296 stop:622 length:327 start_codon:yes stop_codon:yes gene_type:complete
MKKMGAEKKWTNENINLVRDLLKNNSAREVGIMFGKSKNSILGILYREKVAAGYVPPKDSPWANIRKTYHRKNLSLGKIKCYICSTTFIKSGQFDRFCYECKRTGRVA